MECSHFFLLVILFLTGKCVQVPFIETGPEGDYCVPDGGDILIPCVTRNNITDSNVIISAVQRWDIMFIDETMISFNSADPSLPAGYEVDAEEGLTINVSAVSNLLNQATLQCVAVVSGATASSDNTTLTVGFSPGSFNCSCSCLFTRCDVTCGDPYVAICVPIVNVTLSTTDDTQGTDLDPILRMSSDNDFLNINMLNSGTQYTFNVTTSNIIGSSSDETTCITGSPPSNVDVEIIKDGIDTFAIVKWSSSSLSNGESVTEYKVTIGSVSGTTTNTNITLNVSSLIESNSPNKTYSAGVVARYPSVNSSIVYSESFGIGYIIDATVTGSGITRTISCELATNDVGAGCRVCVNMMNCIDYYPTNSETMVTGEYDVMSSGILTIQAIDNETDVVEGVFLFKEVSLSPTTTGTISTTRTLPPTSTTMPTTTTTTTTTTITTTTSTTTTITTIISPTQTAEPAEFPIASVVGGVVGGVVIILLIIIIIIIILVWYRNKKRSGKDHSSTTGPYQNISSVSNVTKTSNFEMKDNQAYGVVTTPTISTHPVYEIMS